MQTVFELSRDRLIELKQHFLTIHLDEVEGREPSVSELADADDIVDDATVFEAYSGTVFSSDDFRC